MCGFACLRAGTASATPVTTLRLAPPSRGRPGCISLFDANNEAFLTRSESWVHRLALQGQHAKDALMHPPQRFLPHEPLQPFDSECELAERQRPFVSKSTVAKTTEVRVG